MRNGECRLWCLLALLITATNAEAQDSSRGSERSANVARHAIYLELLGSSPLYSLNYEYRPVPSFALRCGLTTQSDGTRQYVEMPLMMSGLIGHAPKWLELGIGGTLGIVRVTRGVWSGGAPSWLTAIIGFRHEPTSGGFIFRFSYTPLVMRRFATDGAGGKYQFFWLWGGVSFGWGF